VPGANVDPDAGAQLTALAPSTRSLDALKSTLAPPGPVASAVTFAGSSGTAWS
jgi:hypothetical protein